MQEDSFHVKAGLELFNFLQKVWWFLAGMEKKLKITHMFHMLGPVYQLYIYC